METIYLTSAPIACMMHGTVKTRTIMQRGTHITMNEITVALDCVDDRMHYLGSSLNLLDPDGTFKGMPSEEVLTKIMEAVREDYRKLSDAIHVLRQEVQDNLMEGDSSRES